MGPLIFDYTTITGWGVLLRNRHRALVPATAIMESPSSKKLEAGVMRRSYRDFFYEIKGDFGRSISYS